MKKMLWFLLTIAIIVLVLFPIAVTADSRASPTDTITLPGAISNSSDTIATDVTILTISGQAIVPTSPRGAADASLTSDLISSAMMGTKPVSLSSYGGLLTKFPSSSLSAIAYNHTLMRTLLGHLRV